MSVSDEDRIQIIEAIELYRCGFAAIDVEALKGIWDRDYERIIYIAQELAEPLRGWSTSAARSAVAEPVRRDKRQLAVTAAVIGVAAPAAPPRSAGGEGGRKPPQT